MGSQAIPVVLFFLFLFIAWRMIFSQNGDLYRVRAWRELARRALPFAVLTLMILSLPVVALAEGWIPIAWAVFFVVAIIAANLLATPAAERKATRAYRQRNFDRAIELFRGLAEERQLPRYYMLLGAALGSNDQLEESVKASSRAIELDPQYGIAYYNRALIQRQHGRRGKAKSDLRKALEADLPRRFRSQVKRLLEENGE